MRPGVSMPVGRLVVSGSEEAEGSLPTFRKVWSARLYMEALVTLISKEIEGYYLQGKEAKGRKPSGC